MSRAAPLCLFAFACAGMPRHAIDGPGACPAADAGEARALHAAGKSVSIDVSPGLEIREHVRWEQAFWMCSDRTAYAPAFRREVLFRVSGQDVCIAESNAENVGFLGCILDVARDIAASRPDPGPYALFLQAQRRPERIRPVKGALRTSTGEGAF